jgi:hypothetical protein
MISEEWKKVSEKLATVSLPLVFTSQKYMEFYCTK